MKRPAFAMACAVLAGAVTGRILEFSPFLAGAAVLALLGGAAFVFARARRQGSPARRALSGEGRPPNPTEDAGDHELVIRLALAGLFCLALFQQSAEVRREQLAERQVEVWSRRGPLILRGTVAAEPALLENGERALLILRDVAVSEIQPNSPDASTTDALVSAVPLSNRVQVSLLRNAAASFGGALPFQGQRLEIRGSLRAPPEIRHPDLFDYRAFLRSRGIGALVSVWMEGQARRLEDEDRAVETAIFSALMRWRRFVLNLLEQNLPPDRAGVIQAMLLGETSGLNPQIREDLARAGIAHLFAVSGLHTAMLALMIFVVCRLLQAPPRVSAWLLFLFLAVYCVLVGFRAPVVRGTVMACCLAMPILLRRAVDHLTAFSIALLVTVLINPLAILRTDFQFSYLCAFGLIVLTPTLRETLSFPIGGPSYPRRRLAALWNHWIALPLAVVIAAQLSVAPLLSIYFHQFSLIGFFANLALVPLATVLLAAAWAMALLGAASIPAATVLAPFLSWLTGQFTSVAGLFAAVPGAAFFLPAFPWWLILAYCLILFSGPHLRMLRAPGALETRRAGLLLRIMVLVALLALWPPAARLSVLTGEPPADFQLTMLDVGQGDCLILRLPDGHVVMVDTGRVYSARTILEYLRDQNIDELDALVLTHGDADHIGAAAELIERFYVRRLVAAESFSGTRLRAGLEAAIQRVGVPVTIVSRGDRLEGTGIVRFEVLNPPGSDREAAALRDANERSIVLLVAYGRMTFLLTGDAGIAAENEMREFWGSKALEAEALKVGHHGSRTSTGEAFVQAVRPRIALLSVGARNSYGHPSPEVVERLEKAGARILSTAIHGSVDLRTDGRRLWIRLTRED